MCVRSEKRRSINHKIAWESKKLLFGNSIFDYVRCSIRCDMIQNAFSSLKWLMIHEELSAEHWRWLCHFCFRWHRQRKKGGIVMKLLLFHETSYAWLKRMEKMLNERDGNETCLLSFIKFVKGIRMKIRFSRSKNNFVLLFVIWLRNDMWTSSVLKVEKFSKKKIAWFLYIVDIAHYYQMKFNFTIEPNPSNSCRSFWKIKW